MASLHLRKCLEGKEEQRLSQLPLPIPSPVGGEVGGPGTSTSVTVLYHLQARALSYTHNLLQTSNKGPALLALRQA